MIIHKIYWDREGEEKWLNEMCAKGWALIEYHWLSYTFVPCAPGEFVYRIELLAQLPSRPKSRDYLDFLAQTGVQCISTYLRWVYLRRPAAEGVFDIYSDTKSKIKHFGRSAFFYGVLFAAYTWMVIFNIINVANSGMPASSGFWLSIVFMMGIVAAVAVLMGYLFFKSLWRMWRLKQAGKLRE